MIWDAYLRICQGLGITPWDGLAMAVIYILAPINGYRYSSYADLACGTNRAVIHGMGVTWVTAFMGAFLLVYWRSNGEVDRHVLTVLMMSAAFSALIYPSSTRWINGSLRYWLPGLWNGIKPTRREWSPEERKRNLAQGDPDDTIEAPLSDLDDGK